MRRGSLAAATGRAFWTTLSGRAYRRRLRSRQGARDRGAQLAVRVDPGPRVAREAAHGGRHAGGEPLGQLAEATPLGELEQLAILGGVAHELEPDRLHREAVRAAEPRGEAGVEERAVPIPCERARAPPRIGAPRLEHRVVELARDALAVGEPAQRARSEE